LRLLIDDVRLWDGTGSKAQPRMAVEIREGRIYWIGSASEWQGNRSNVKVVDGRARTLIPGLMDCHVHYSGLGGPEWIARFTDPLPDISMRAVELAEASLRSGVTTARDAGAPQGVSIKLAHKARAGEIRAPNI
jgi:imidazolonepropionase-like amidohydrolase